MVLARASNRSAARRCACAPRATAAGLRRPWRRDEVGGQRRASARFVFAGGSSPGAGKSRTSHEPTSGSGISLLGLCARHLESRLAALAGAPVDDAIRSGRASALVRPTSGVESRLVLRSLRIAVRRRWKGLPVPIASPFRVSRTVCMSTESSTTIGRITAATTSAIARCVLIVSASASTVSDSHRTRPSVSDSANGPLARSLAREH